AIWLAWSIGFAASIAAVHRVLARHRRPRAWPDHALAAGLAIALVAGGVLARTTPLAVIPLPLCAVSLALVVRPPSARRVRTVGVVLLAAALITAAITAAISAAILSAG
ncbi:MAG TPA: hypothetical protein VFP84_11785, partial [Kofleriaceae bacterium]|nr:hypothetical protein [Kofleriaceae bacterium]